MMRGCPSFGCQKYIHVGEKMIYADLITGFLGAGKTTFIRKYAAYWASKGQKVCVLENDYGAINVDVAFLENNEGLQLDTAMIVGGDGADAHKRRFKTKLITLAMSGYQRIIIEPSGIFDMDEFFDTLYEDPLESMYSIGNVIAIADAGLPDDLSEESDYILASEIADAGIVLISKASSYSASRIGKVEEHISSALSAI
jgi:G3E family GTPase